jgi:antirestriction protein
MSIKQKFSSIDQSKLTADQKSFLDKIKNVTKNFTDAEMNKKVEQPLDNFIAKAKEKMPEAIKSAPAKSKAKTSQTRKPKRTAMSLAKEIRKEGETWKDAQVRARKMMKEGSQEVSKTVETELDKLSKLVRSQKERKKLTGLSGTNIKRDAVRRAKPKGRRISKDGNVYYENRDNRTDRLAPNYPKNAPLLAEGGNIDAFTLRMVKSNGMQPAEVIKEDANVRYKRGGSLTNERRYVNKGEDYEVRYSKPILRRKGYKGVRGFELGGVMATDLAGHTGGGDAGFNAGMPLDGFSNTSYTGLVGETGAMSSGELFMNGGGLPSGSEQSYMITESFGNPAQHYAKGGGVRRVGNREYSYGRNWTNDHRHVNKGEDHEVKYTRKGKFLGVFDDGGKVANWVHYDKYHLINTENGMIVLKNTNLNDIQHKDIKGFDILSNRGYNKGGAIKNQYAGRTPEDIWDSLSVEQKVHFVDDHFRYLGTNMYKYFVKVAKENRPYKSLPTNLKLVFDYHISEGQYNKGGALTNERLHVNHDEDYEVRYAKPRPKRKGYKGARKFMAGGMNNETPRIYVADLEAYNNGRLVGEWLDLSDYNDADELMDAIQDVLKKSGGEEYAIHDYENFPSILYSEYMSRNDFQALYDVMETAKQNDLPLEVVQDIVSQYGEGGVEEFYGKFDSAEDFAYQQVEELGLENFNSPEYYVYITDTDRRLLAQDMANSYVEDINYEGGGNRLIEEAGMDVEEYEEADNETQQEMIDRATEIVYDEYYDNWYDGLSDPYYFLVDEQGMYSPDDFFNASFISVDYEKLARDLEQDYTFIEYDGDLYVFNIR